MQAMFCRLCIGDRPISLPCWIARRQDSGLPRKSFGAKSEVATILANRKASSIVARDSPLAGVVVVLISVLIVIPFVFASL
jgi:hypothetical protein